MTVAEAYEIYKKAVYGDMKLSAVQAKEVKQAFYGGALIMFEVINGETEKPEEEAFDALDRLHTECKAFTEELAKASGRQN